MALIDKLTAIADAVRAKTGGTELLTLDAIASAISGIQSSDSPETNIGFGYFIGDGTNRIQLSIPLESTNVLIWYENLVDCMLRSENFDSQDLIAAEITQERFRTISVYSKDKTNSKVVSGYLNGYACEYSSMNHEITFQNGTLTIGNINNSSNTSSPKKTANGKKYYWFAW